MTQEPTGPETATPEQSPSAGGQTTPLSLLERARARDQNAWQGLVEIYRPLVLFWCRRGGLTAEDAEDVTQEAFAAVARGLDGFRRDRPGDTFRGWLRVIVRNELLMHHRRQQGRPRAEGGSDAWKDLQAIADPLAGADEEESLQIGQVYRRALELVRGEFEERTWQAFWLSAVESRSPSALAAELGMTPAAIRQARSRVLRRLKQETGDLLD
jgi:RNA polymerase sigma-70 factor (ECF subfamily)